MDLSHAHILLIGAGKMGGALLAAWLRSGLRADAVTVLDPHAASHPEGVRVVSSLQDISGPFDCIVLAVKPQTMDSVLTSLASVRPASALVLSIAAGKTLAYFEQHLGDAAIVRAMPNTPALIRKGITALIANARTSDTQRQLADHLLAAAGRTVWLESETQMDAVTAVSGSGPAYMFLFLEALIAAGMAQGLSEEMATQLALQTMRGSVKLAQKSDDSLAQLRKNVTSPGGTTEAALNVLMTDDALATLLGSAVDAAVKRARELA